MKEDIKKLKEKLWKFGYSVRDYSELSETLGYNVIVDGEHKLKIVEEFPSDASEIIYAIVDDKDILFNNGQTISRSPYDIFGRPKTYAKITKGQNGESQSES